MRRKKGLLFVVSLLALASLMAAMSFSSVSVEAKAKMRIVGPKDGLLALLPGNGGASSINGNNLLIDLTEGSDEYGLQPGSTYTWDSLFKLKNNSNQAIQVKVNDLKGLAELGVVSTTVYVNGKNEGPISDYVTLNSGDTANVQLTISVNKNAPTMAKAATENITISARAVGDNNDHHDGD